jgi:aminoglycoside 3-N-acetyltransferase
VLSRDQERQVLEKHPPFDPLTARSSRSHGILVEFFRTYPGTVVNRHTARFAAAGKHAEAIVAQHPWNYPYGAGTPLQRFLDLGGKILLLGSDHDEVTFLHYVEHVVPFPGKRVAAYRVPVEEDGRTIWRETAEFNTAGDGVHPNWPDRFFAELVDGYLAHAHNPGALVGDARSFLFSARELLDFAGPRMQERAGSSVG